MPKKSRKLKKKNKRKKPIKKEDEDKKKKKDPMTELTELVKGLLSKSMQGHNNGTGHQTHDDRDAFMLKA